jgi:hypothetical protein
MVMLFGVSYIKNNLDKGMQTLNAYRSKVSTRMKAKAIPSALHAVVGPKKASDPSILIGAVTAHDTPCLIASM